MLPFDAVYEEYLARGGYEEDYYSPLKQYEKDVLLKR
jgi:L-rhamnose isomerase